MKPDSLRRTVLCAAVGMATFAAGMYRAGAQAGALAPGQKPRIIYYTPQTRITAAAMARLRNGQANTSTIPLWNITTTGYDGKPYSVMMVGRSPFAHGHRSTTIPTFIVPVILNITNSQTGHVEAFDPTAPEPNCTFDGSSVVTQLIQSPIFQSFDFVMNGVDVGTTQYLDAFQRANFWSQVSGTPYGTVFTANPTVLAAVIVNVPPASGDVHAMSFPFGCRDLGLMDIHFWLPLVNNTILPMLASSGVNPTNFPQFLFDSVGMTVGAPALSNCCVLGFHNALSGNGAPLQTYSTNDYDVSGAFTGGTNTLSHEVAEWMDDPTVQNFVPPWGAEGQQRGCQTNLEVGDPLSPNNLTPTNPFFKTNTNGTTYELQELALYSWFIGDVPSLGAGGGYSDNGTFVGHAKACPPGGTN